MSLLGDILEAQSAGGQLAARGRVAKPAVAASNKARPGDRDYGQPGPADPKHPRGRKGSSQGGQFVSKGMTGGNVSKVQTAVGAPVTGSFGSNTVAAVQAFQKRHGLQVDGVVGRQTALAIHGAYREARATKPGAMDAATRSRTGLGSRQGAARPKAPATSRPKAQRVRGGALLASDDPADVLSEAELAEAEMWDPLQHPRNAVGRFADKLRRLTPRGQAGPTAVSLPDGTRVSKDANGTFRVVRSGRNHTGIATPETAAVDALLRSGRSTHPQSFGGTTPVTKLEVPADNLQSLRAERARVAASTDRYERRHLPSLDAHIAAVERRQGGSGQLRPTDPAAPPNPRDATGTVEPFRGGRGQARPATPAAAAASPVSVPSSAVPPHGYRADLNAPSSQFVRHAEQQPARDRVANTADALPTSAQSVPLSTLQAGERFRYSSGPGSATNPTMEMPRRQMRQSELRAMNIRTGNSVGHGPSHRVFPVAGPTVDVGPAPGLAGPAPRPATSASPEVAYRSFTDATLQQALAAGSLIQSPTQRAEIKAELTRRGVPHVAPAPASPVSVPSDAPAPRMTPDGPIAERPLPLGSMTTGQRFALTREVGAPRFELLSSRDPVTGLHQARRLDTGAIGDWASEFTAYPVGGPHAPGGAAQAPAVGAGEPIPRGFEGVRVGDRLIGPQGEFRVSRTNLYASGGNGIRRPPGISVRRVGPNASDRLGRASTIGENAAILRGARWHPRASGGVPAPQPHTQPSSLAHPQEVTVQGPLLGRDATLHLRRSGDNYVTRDPIGLAQTRTGSTQHPTQLEFEPLAGRTLSPRHPRIEIAGETYALRMNTVARNRPASIRAVHSDAGPQNYDSRFHRFDQSPLRPAGAATPAAATREVISPVGTQGRVLVRGAVSRIPESALGTRVESVKVVGEHTFVRGQDGRSWTIRHQDIAAGRIGPESVQVRLQTGALYTAPAMERALAQQMNVPVPASASRSSVQIVGDRPTLPAAPAGRTAAGASTAGPSAPLADVAARASSTPAPAVGGTGPLVAKAQTIVASIHGFEHNGYRARVDSASTRGFSGVVLDPHGRQVGTFSREIRDENTIYHALFSISGEHRQSGFGTAFIEHSFATYKRQGFKQVDVTAGLDVGGYQWAKMGFEFKSSDKAATARELYSYKRSQMAGLVRDGRISQDLLQEFERQMTEGMLTSPSQIAAWGRGTTWTEDRAGKSVTLWLGKALLLGSGWSGRKKL